MGTPRVRKQELDDEKILDKIIKSVGTMQIELNVLRSQKDDLIEKLRDMVEQHCSHEGVFFKGDPDDPNCPKVGCALDSMALSANAQAMILLASYEELVIESQFGRRIAANWTKKEEEKQP